MLSLSPSRCCREAQQNLYQLITRPCSTSCFQSYIRRLNKRFQVYASTSPAPLPATGLIITPEMRSQSELYLPVADIARAFQQLYRSALTYPPFISSTPFHNALSWADAFTALPSRFQFSANPARLLAALLADYNLLVEFLFISFLPSRFYGGFRRYPHQMDIIREWLKARKTKTVRCLDAACGTGEDTYGLTRLLMERGLQSEDIQIEGWTIEPLEVWSAAHGCFPHDRLREASFREETSQLIEQGLHIRISFSCADLLDPPQVEQFDLILCNGLLGGPTINTSHEMGQVVGNLAHLLAPGGILLTANHFHGGWIQKCPQENLRALFKINSLKTFETNEGLGGLKPYQQTAPGEATTKAHGQDQVARLDGSVAQVFVQHQRH